MHKFKPHKGLKKRVKVTARGKVMREMSFAGHLMSKKSGRRRQDLRRKVALKGRYAYRALRALGRD